MPEAFESILKYIYTGRFATLKIYIKSCLRLAKLFKLNDLLEKFSTELFLLNIENGEVKLDEFYVENKEFDEEKLIHETDIFSTLIQN